MGSLFYKLKENMSNNSSKTSYCHASPYKTEIIKKLMDQYRKINGKQLQIQVDNKLVYSPSKNKQKGIKTIDFREDSQIKIVN
jgi:hypothetical protein